MAGIQLNSPSWSIRTGTTTRGLRTGVAGDTADFPPEFLTSESEVVEEFAAEPKSSLRGSGEAPDALDFSYDLSKGEAAILALRHPSGALTFHLPVRSQTRSLQGANQVRFAVRIRPTNGTGMQRGILDKVVKAVLIKVAQGVGDKLVSLALPRLAEAFEGATWRKHGLLEGWKRVSRATLAAKETADHPALEPGVPTSAERSLLFLHGTFSNTAAAYKSLAGSGFFESVKSLYGDRIFGFDHFTISRTPEENARMLLEALPADQATTFDVITHSRGGLVLRNLVERAHVFGPAAKRFRLGRAILVASPNQGTPLANSKRWEDTVGWVANLLEMFPENPFTSGAAFVADGLVWMARHASGDLPGLHSMDGSGDLIHELQISPEPPDGTYSALVANYNPTGEILLRMLDAGVDQFFGSANDLVVPTESGWRVLKQEPIDTPGERIGCFGPGGNLQGDLATHVNLFALRPTADFLVRALTGVDQMLRPMDPLKALPDHRILREGPANVPIAATSVTPVTMERVAGVTALDLPSSGKFQNPLQPILQVTVINGDLCFERKPLLLGHYRATRLTGTERVMNELIGGAMQHSLDLGLYPRIAGTHQVFVNLRTDPEKPNGLPRPEAVIIAGLGEEGKLSAADLVRTIRQAVIAWAQRMAEAKKVPAVLEISATLIGSGGSGVTAGQAALRLVQGVYEANQLLAGESGQFNASWPHVRHLHIIELYLDRATEAWRALRMQAENTVDRFSVTDEIKTGTGSLPRPLDSGYRGASYDFITVEAMQERNGQTSIQYTLDTKRARSEVRARHTQGLLLRDLVASASNASQGDPQIGRTLFKLLVPFEMQAYLAGSSEMQIELGPKTAGIPWELLDIDEEDREARDSKPWAIRTKLLRKLRTTEFRERVIDANAEASVLIIGEPKCPSNYPRLPGAQAEAVAVSNSFKGLPQESVRKLFSADGGRPGPDAGEVVNALFERAWRIVHVSGHGQLAAGDGTPGGVVLSNGAFLGPSEIDGMRIVPELVFINCCHLAGRSLDQLPGADTRQGYDRVAFASGVAEELIKIGVRCVIAAGWAVGDEAAQTFATQFYKALVEGNRFIDAVGVAREKTFDSHPDDKTWAAYQCYGDPDWVFLANSENSESQGVDPEVEFAGVASATALKLALETIVVQTKFQHYSRETQMQKVQWLEHQFSSKWGNKGAVAEWFGAAFAEVRGTADAIRWYQRAVSAVDGSSSMRAAEQLANLCSRSAWEAVETAIAEVDAMRADLLTIGDGRTAALVKARAQAKRSLAAAEKGVVTAARNARSTIIEATGLLGTLVALHPSVERSNIYGSAYKRLALVEAASDHPTEEGEAIREMKQHYKEAAALAKKNNDTDTFYPVLNYLAAEVVLHAGQVKWSGPDKDLIAAAHTSLDAKTNGEDPDFWSVAGQAELQMYEALIRRRLANERASLEEGYANLHRRVKAPWMWSSVYDTALFVLQRYKTRTTPKEVHAADAILASLMKFAKPA